MRFQPDPVKFLERCRECTDEGVCELREGHDGAHSVSISATLDVCWHSDRRGRIEFPEKTGRLPRRDG